MKMRFPLYVLLIITLLSVSTLVSACSNKETFKKSSTLRESASSFERKEVSATIEKVYTELQEDSGWWVVPKEAKKIVIKVDAKNVDTFLFWSAPTGTETGNKRQTNRV